MPLQHQRVVPLGSGLHLRRPALPVVLAQRLHDGRDAVLDLLGDVQAGGTNRLPVGGRHCGPSRGDVVRRTVRQSRPDLAVRRLWARRRRPGGIYEGLGANPDVPEAGCIGIHRDTYFNLPKVEAKNG
jgi:hypothetical protein